MMNRVAASNQVFLRHLRLVALSTTCLPGDTWKTPMVEIVGVFFLCRMSCFTPSDMSQLSIGWCMVVGVKGTVRRSLGRWPSTTCQTGNAKKGPVCAVRAFLYIQMVFGSKCEVGLVRSVTGDSLSVSLSPVRRFSEGGLINHPFCPKTHLGPDVMSGPFSYPYDMVSSSGVFQCCVP